METPPSIEPPDFDSLEVVRSDAWTGGSAASAALSLRWDRWALTKPILPSGQALLPPPPPSPQDWQHPDIGWGVILLDNDDFTREQRAAGVDAPEPIRALLAHRAVSKVLRYRPGLSNQNNTLRDYAASTDVLFAVAPVGVGPGAIPDYLLIVGAPSEIPWTLQYKLNLVRKVGRLDLDAPGLSNYVSALIDDWSSSNTDYSSPVIWAVNIGDDITPLMRDAVAAPLNETFRNDPDLDAAVFVDGTATAALLRDSLAARGPSVIVTTSHGKTAPLDHPEEMRRQLGLLVDVDGATVHPSDLLAGWQPGGAIWLAQACCSAGAHSPSLYHQLFEPNSEIGQVLDGVAALGPLTSPLPKALLGAPHPLRAFIGHVEPTFDWTMWYPPTRAQLTSWVRDLIYLGICGGMPVGLALHCSRIYNAVGALLLQYQDAVARHAEARDADARRLALKFALYEKVTAYDRAATVLLGDPTVAIGVPSGSGGR